MAAAEAAASGEAAAAAAAAGAGAGARGGGARGRALFHAVSDGQWRADAVDSKTRSSENTHLHKCKHKYEYMNIFIEKKKNEEKMGMK